MGRVTSRAAADLPPPLTWAGGRHPAVPVDLDAAPVDAAPTPVRPPLKWAGGKRWQVPHVLPYWRRESHRRLVEPFAGGLAVTLGLLPKRALLNDINPHLINFYRFLRKGLVVRRKFDQTERGYYRARTRFNDLLGKGQAETAEAAALFYYLNRTGYNGLCRFNRSGGFNVPFGQHPTLNYTYDFMEYKKIFAGWTFANTHFSDVALDPEDFVYADPPYDVEFRNYSQGGFSWEDQVATAEWLSRHRGPVVLSNQATERIMQEYTRLGFRLQTFHAPRKISCTGDRSPAVEVLAIRNLPV
jgi:DNA adenine methylase